MPAASRKQSIVADCDADFAGFASGRAAAESRQRLQFMPKLLRSTLVLAAAPFTAGAAAQEADPRHPAPGFQTRTPGSALLIATISPGRPPPSTSRGGSPPS
ncbi:MAG: hypothetical protein ACYC0T_01070 [Ramlibacter sp.]